MDWNPTTWIRQAASNSEEAAPMKRLIQQTDFFSGLEDKILAKVAEAALIRRYAREEVIVRQGETGLGLYIIVRGRVRVEREHDGTRVQVAELGPEQSFAEMSVVDNKPRSATVTATEDSECLLLTRDSFVKLMQKYPEIPIRTARVLAERLRVANEKLATAGPATTTAAPPPPPVAQPAGPSAGDQTPEAGQSSAAKARVQEALIKMFQGLYTVKAFTRFSVAVLGCPVEGAAPNLVDEIRIGDVKALLLPADEAVRMNITAQAEGSFTLHVLVPAESKPIRFGPVPVHARDRFQLLLDPPRIQLSCQEPRPGPLLPERRASAL